MPATADRSSQATPAVIDALIDEGNALEDAGQIEAALARYDSAVQRAPEFARTHLNRGNALLAINRVEEAKEAYVTALRHNPDYPAAEFNLGNACARLGESEEALRAYLRALSLRPDFADAEFALGALYEDLGSQEEAAETYQRALRIAPDYAPVHVNLGDMMLYLNRCEEAISSYRRALELDHGIFTVAQRSQIHNKIGCMLLAIGPLRESLPSFRAMLDADPESAEAHFNIGRALFQLNENDAATESYRAAVRLDPRHAAAQQLLGNALLDKTKLEEALGCYRRAVEINPNDPYPHLAEGNALTLLSDTPQALASYSRALELKPELADARSNLLVVHNYMADTEPLRLLEEARAFGDIAERSATPFRTWQSPAEAQRQLKVGIVSADFREHPVSYFLHNILDAIKTDLGDRLEIHAYSSRGSTDAMARRIQALCAGWCVAAGLSDDDFARRIHDDHIDILIDLSGHSGGNRLTMFAWKPAPVQITWLGYFATTGVKAIDYLIADPWSLPESEEVHFTERIWRLPETRLCYSPPGPALTAGPLPALKNGYITFGSFNNLAKMNDAVVALWSRVMSTVRGSRLMLKSIALGEQSVQDRTIARFRAHAVDESRLTLEGPSPRNEYLAAYRRIDIALDPFPYTGGATTVDGLWMGVPAVTLAGRSFLARQGAGLLANAGLKDWIAEDADRYVAIAARQSADFAGLSLLRLKLRQQVVESPIFDVRRFAVHFEAALREIWTRWCDNHVT